jgi:hypothetical protein
MTCPHCNHEFPLTWGRYLASPLGRHTCPACKKPSRLKVSILSVSLLIPAVFIGGIPLEFLFRKWFGGQSWIAGFILGAFIVAIPADKWIDAKFKRLKKIDSP